MPPVASSWQAVRARALGGAHPKMSRVNIRRRAFARARRLAATPSPRGSERFSDGFGRLTGTGVDARLRRARSTPSGRPSTRTSTAPPVPRGPDQRGRHEDIYRSLLPRPGRQPSRCAAIYDDVSQARGSCRLGSNQWCDFERNRKCVDRSECVWCYDRLGAHPGGLKVVNLTASHLARKMARRDKRHRRSGRPVVQHDIQKTRFVKNMQRKRPACEATAEGCTPEEMERWAGIS